MENISLKLDGEQLNDGTRIRISESCVLDFSNIEEIFNSLERTDHQISFLSGVLSYILFHINSNINNVYKLDEEEYNKVINFIREYVKKNPENKEELEEDIKFLTDLHQFYKDYDNIISLSPIQKSNIILLNNTNSTQSKNNFINEKINNYISKYNFQTLLHFQYIVNSIIYNLLQLKEINPAMFEKIASFYNKINIDQKILNDINYSQSQLNENFNNNTEQNSKKDNDIEKHKQIIKTINFLYYFSYICTMKNIKPYLIV